ncbi:hypothetical protein [Paenibacillus sp. DYY-L-2]|uniref:hypothetical protein n=1 Tax=Paenibacillus sp. DYY-L-2 TaxID=3447013 RepID=UPI003F4F5EA5
MKIIKIISSYLFVAVCIAAFGLFIYPGVYKYDKLNQKYPVKINRITGETQVLYSDGWRNMDGYDGAAKAMENYKNEIEQMISEQNEEITNNVLESIQGQLEIIKQNVISTPVSEQSSEYDAVRNRDKTNAEETTTEYFSKGDTSERVKEVMGTPTGISSIIEGHESWYYDSSVVQFKDGKVTGWHDLSDNLLVK